MDQRRIRSIAVIGAVSALTFVAGCDDSDTPSPAPTKSISVVESSSTPSTTSVVVTEPEDTGPAPNGGNTGTGPSVTVSGTPGGTGDRGGDVCETNPEDCVVEPPPPGTLDDFPPKEQ